MLPLSIIFSSILGCLESEDTGTDKEPAKEPSTEPSSPTTEPATEASSEPTSEPSSPTTEPATEVSSEPSSPTSEPTSEIFENDCTASEDWCNYFSETYTISSSDYTAQLDVNGNLTSEGCFALCELGNLQSNGFGIQCYSSCEETGMNTDGTYAISCGYYAACIVEGRGSACIEKETAGTGDNNIGAWFARAHHAEKGSVFAFEQLRRDLIKLEAPSTLIAKIEDAIREEAEHTSMMKDFAIANKGKIMDLIFDGFLDTRSVWDIAVENLLEGCINESYAALQAFYQSRHAESEQIQGLFATIARDECKHAEIAREVHHFLLPLLSNSQQRELKDLGQKKWKDLQKSLYVQKHIPELDILGVPTPQIGAAMAKELERFIG